MLKPSEFALTLDLDWAPDAAIAQVTDLLLEARVKATVFVTHLSPAVARLQAASDLIELGIHPNFLPGSTHGTSEDAIFRHLLELVPDAHSMRSHGLVQSSPLLAKAALEYGIDVDVSLFLPHAPCLEPHQLNWARMGLWRIPFYWEDDAEMAEVSPMWDLEDPRLKAPGLKIFNFHPVHVALNTQQFGEYQRLKGLRPISAWDADFLAAHRARGPGPGTLFCSLVALLSAGGSTVCELIQSYQHQIHRDPDS